ncbi:MAG: hypothetical protein QXP77_02230 [Candidatus Aenigmatarchaeota archaeon]
MEYIPRYTEEKELFGEIPLFAELTRFGTPESYSIKRLIDGKRIKGMTVKDVIKFCINDAKTSEEKTVAEWIRSFISSGDYQISINQMSNINPDKLILDYTRGKSKKEIEGKEIICHYANIQLSPAGELR